MCEGPAQPWHTGAWKTPSCSPKAPSPAGLSVPTHRPGPKAPCSQEPWHGSPALLPSVHTALGSSRPTGVPPWARASGATPPSLTPELGILPLSCSFRKPPSLVGGSSGSAVPFSKPADRDVGGLAVGATRGPNWGPPSCRGHDKAGGGLSSRRRGEARPILGSQLGPGRRCWP